MCTIMNNKIINLISYHLLRIKHIANITLYFILQVSWLYANSKGIFEKYSDDVNLKLEETFSKTTSYSWKDPDGTVHFVDFTKMCEIKTKVGGAKKEKKVWRKTKGEGEY